MFSLFVTFIYNVLKNLWSDFQNFCKTSQNGKLPENCSGSDLKKKKTFRSLDRKKEHQQIFHGVKT